MTARRTSHRPRSVVLAAAVLSTGLVLTGCGDQGGGGTTATATPTSSTTQTASPTDTGSASAADSGSASVTGSPSGSTSSSPSGTDSAAPSATATATPRAGAIDLDQELPGKDLGPTDPYDGPPRKFSQTHHLPCLQAIMGEQKLPEMEWERGREGDLDVMHLISNHSVTEGWKLCLPEVMAGFAAPATFTVEAESSDEYLSTLKIFDGNGQRIGGLSRSQAGSDAGSTQLLKVLKIEKGEAYPAHGEETPYLRSLVVEGKSGPQLLVDQVTVPADTDPKSLQAWDVEISGGQGHRVQVWAAVPLESAADADKVADSRMHEVLRQIVGSFRPAVQ